MNDNNNRSDQKTTTALWPGKLNKLLIGVGVVAFGLIIADRLMNMFQADDLPDTAAIEKIVETPAAAMPADENQAASEVTADEPGLRPEPDQLRDLAEVFGSRVVFVSASEPLYVLTEDDRRIDVGDQLDAGTTLAGVSIEQIVLEKDGVLLAIGLPDPASQ